MLAVCLGLLLGNGERGRPGARWGGRGGGITSLVMPLCVARSRSVLKGVER